MIQDDSIAQSSGKQEPAGIQPVSAANKMLATAEQVIGMDGLKDQKIWIHLLFLEPTETCVVVR